MISGLLGLKWWDWLENRIKQNIAAINPVNDVYFSLRPGKLADLCTIPKYRKKGLAATALSEHYRRLKPLGATHMTGGGNTFYEKIGFKPLVYWTFWEKQTD